MFVLSMVIIVTMYSTVWNGRAVLLVTLVTGRGYCTTGRGIYNGLAPEYGVAYENWRNYNQGKALSL